MRDVIVACALALAFVALGLTWRNEPSLCAQVLAAMPGSECRTDMECECLTGEPIDMGDATND